MTRAPYRAFFQNSCYEKIVDRVFSSISIGEPVRLDVGKDIVAPRLVCALKPDAVIAHGAGQDIDIDDVCKGNPTWTVMYYPGTSIMFIFLVFFLMPTPPAAGNCATVNEATNRFEGNFTASWQSQMCMLLHETAHVYIGATAENSVNGTMGWTDGLSLSPPIAACNALNCVFFVASKRAFISDGWSAKRTVSRIPRFRRRQRMQRIPTRRSIITFRRSEAR